jgi:hypothetical protein
MWLAPYRAYNTGIGRWISRDPIAEDGGINLYAYVGNRVMVAFDPLGLLDKNYFGSKDPIHDTANGVPTVPDESRLAGHGTPDGALKPGADPNSYGPEDIIPPEELGGTIKDLPQSKQGKPARLMMCDLGKNPDYLQKVADAAGVPVMATDDKIYWPVYKNNPVCIFFGGATHSGAPDLVKDKLPSNSYKPTLPKSSTK